MDKDASRIRDRTADPLKDDPLTEPQSPHPLRSPSFSTIHKLKTLPGVRQPSQMGWRWQVVSMNPYTHPVLISIHTLTVRAEAHCVCVILWKPTVSRSSLLVYQLWQLGLGGPHPTITLPQANPGIPLTRTHKHWPLPCLSHFCHHTCAKTHTHVYSRSICPLTLRSFLPLPQFLQTHLQTHTNKDIFNIVTRKY